MHNLWLEDLADPPDDPWSLEHFVLAARHLGQLNGHYAKQPLWLVRSWERMAMRRDGNNES